MISVKDILRVSSAWAGFVFLLIAFVAPASIAQTFELESTGVRFGASPTEAAHDFHEADAFLNCNLPWSWDLGTWFVRLRLDSSAGWLGDPNNDAFIGKLGPTCVVADKETPLSIEGGVSPTVLSHSEFDSKDFGGAFQITAHAGLNVDLGQHFRVGYRFQHMSNAGLFKHNPGLNLHMLAVSYRF